MAVPIATVFKIEPSTVYRFVAGLLGVVACAAFVGDFRFQTDLEALGQLSRWATGHSWSWPENAHLWLIDRSAVIGTVSGVMMVLGVLGASGYDRSVTAWRGGSTALLAWSIAVECGVGGSTLWPAFVILLIPVVICFVRHSTYKLMDACAAMAVSACFALLPVIWLLSRPASGSKAADLNVGG